MCAWTTAGRAGGRCGHLRRIELARVGDHARQHRDGRDRGRAEVDVVVRRPAPSREVSVEGPKRVGARRRRLPHAHARPASRLEHANAGREQVDVRPRLRDLVEDLPRAGSCRRGYELLGDLAPAERRAHDGHVLIGRVDGRADAHLRELRPDELVNGNDVSRARRLRDQRNQRSEIDALGLVEVVLRVAGLEGDELLTPLLFVEPAACLVVGRKHGAGRAELGDHVRDRPALGVAQRLHTRAGELEDCTAAPAHPAPAQQLEDHVLRLDPRPLELVLEEDADDLGARQLERVPRHADRDVEPAGADRDHPGRPRLRRVAVGADEGLARNGEALAVDVVADPVPGPREPGAVLRRHRLEEPVVVGVLEVDLEDVVVDVDDGGVHLDAVVSEQLELHHRHRSGRVLRQRLVDGDRDLLARHELPANEVLLEDRARERCHCPQYRKKWMPISP